jgi:hypothetical protein
VKRFVALAALTTVFSFGASARADEVDACVEGADKAQQLRDQAKLLDARAQLIACAAASCPSAVAKQCARWLREVDEEIPTVSLRVRSSSGADVADADVILDGAPRPGALGGKPLALDPGSHRFAFKRGDETAEAAIVVRAGEKNRLVDVTLTGGVPVGIAVVAPPPPVVEERTSFHFPWTTGLFLGVAVASFAGTAGLVAIASSDAGSLRTTCAPTCTASDVDAAHTKLIVANVTFGIGIASVALAAIFLIAANVGHHPAKRLALSF